MKILKIGNIEKNYDDGTIVLKTIINRSDLGDFELQFRYNLNNLGYVDDTFSDSFIVSLLPYALEFGYDIECINPISEELYYNLINNVIPTLSKYITYFKNIKIKPLSIKSEEMPAIKNGVATGCSCGVDSFHTILMNYGNRNNLTTNTMLTDLVVVNSGACSWKGGEISKKWFNIEVERAKKVAEELGLGLITIDTNLMEFYQCDHAHSGYSRICGTLIPLKRIIQRYYFASGFEMSKFEFTLKTDGAYAYFILNEFSTVKLKFLLSGLIEERYDKVKFIEDFSIVKNHLNVCWNGGANCGKCEKCLRTIGAFYARNKLDEFSNVLNASYFNKHQFIGIAKMIYFSSQHKGQYKFLKDIKKRCFFKYWIAWNISFFIIHPIQLLKRIIRIFIKKRR